MLEVIKHASLNLVGWPDDFPAGIKEFNTHTVIVTNGKKLGENVYCLPGAILLSDKSTSYPVFGLETPERRILIVQGFETEEITDEDLDYFQDLEGFQIYSTMAQKELYVLELFRPVKGLVKSELDREEIDGVVSYVSAMTGKRVYVKKGSNRHKFIEGQENFLDDPLDFYAVKDKKILPDTLSHTSAQRGDVEWNVLYNSIVENTIPACLTLFTMSDVREMAKRAIQYKDELNCKLSDTVYWELAEEPSAAVDRFRDIDWKAVEKLIPTLKKHDEEGLEELIKLISLRSDPSEMGLYSSYIFMMFFLLLEDEKVDFIASAFNLRKDN